MASTTAPKPKSKYRKTLGEINGKILQSDMLDNPKELTKWEQEFFDFCALVAVNKI